MFAVMDETCVLEDGTRLVLRQIVPHDATKLRHAFHALSHDSRYQRFMGQVADLTPAMLEYLTQVDGHDHIAIVALRLDAQEREQEMLAVARLIRTEASGPVAEVAITVADAWQGRGLGNCMMHALLCVPAASSVSQWVAHALPSNRSIRRLLRGHGTVVEHDGVLTVQLPMAPHPLARVMALVAALPGVSRLRRAA